jgi:hypothetical protein
VNCFIWKKVCVNFYCNSFLNMNGCFFFVMTNKYFWNVVIFSYRSQ